MVYLNLKGCYDEFGNFTLDNTTWINLLNTLVNLGILTFTVVLFNHIKWGSKVSDVYKSKQLKELSNRDILTGLYNRMSLTHYIEEVNNSKNKNIIIAMLDIDNFKRINDTYGHTVGDKCIHLVGEKINKITKKGYRYGGEEFLIIFENMDKSDVYNVMEGFRKEIETSETCGVKFTISIGISEYFKPINITDCIEQADSRLYVAKNTGKNKIVNVKS
jgi:diguanylate cyclase (GGDEF)-like protein